MVETGSCNACAKGHSRQTRKPFLPGRLRHGISGNSLYAELELAETFRIRLVDPVAVVLGYGLTQEQRSASCARESIGRP
jgi:hypothetical protein